MGDTLRELLLLARRVCFCVLAVSGELSVEEVLHRHELAAVVADQLIDSSGIALRVGPARC